MGRLKRQTNSGAVTGRHNSIWSLLILEDGEKARVKDSLPDFEPVLYSILQIHHSTHDLIDWDAINQNRKHGTHIWECNWGVENQRGKIGKRPSGDMKISGAQRSSLEPQGKGQHGPRFPSSLLSSQQQIKWTNWKPTTFHGPRMVSSPP